ncbi:MAG: hypothetical protein ABL891_02495 [Burkholderiales bacterium]
MSQPAFDALIASAKFIRWKNAIYHKAGIHTLPGGIPFEVAVVQGKLPPVPAP